MNTKKGSPKPGMTASSILNAALHDYETQGNRITENTQIAVCQRVFDLLMEETGPMRRFAVRRMHVPVRFNDVRVVVAYVATPRHFTVEVREYGIPQ